MVQITLALAVLISATVAFAEQVKFKECRSDLVTEVFRKCNDGEASSATPCGSIKTSHGSVVVRLRVDTAAQVASSDLIYVDSLGKKSKPLKTTCAIDKVSGWMSCATKKPVADLGKLYIDFNPTGIAPDVYFVDIMADAANAPVGGFQTELNCKKE